MNNFNKLITTIFLVLITNNVLLAQTPTIGSVANYVLFTSVGAVTNTGVSHITGNVGSNIGAGTGFGNVDGIMQSGNSSTAQCAIDLNSVYNQLNSYAPDYFIAPLLGNNDTLLPGVYSVAGATTLNGNLILNAQNDSNAIFIFQIQAAFSSNAASKIKLINGALACNVFWKIEGLVDLATETNFKGTIIAHNAGINMNSLDTLEGRVLSTTGAISINGILAYTPLGCGTPILSGPIMPTLGSANTYTLFTSNGAMTNAGISTIVGDVGTNVGLTTGFMPLLVNGTIHPIPDGSTVAAAADLLNAANLMNIIPTDIELLYPAQFGNHLVLTPHAYILNGATSFTDSLYLNAQGNPNAIFFIKINGALSTSVGSHVLLINGAKANNVYWLVSGAVSIGSNSEFVGTLVSINGAINTLTGVHLNGKLLTTNGAFSTTAITTTLAPQFTLPVHWLYFKGQYINQDIVLNWRSLEEINNQYFLIEKSKDGISFDYLTKIMVNNQLNEYEYTDHQPFYTSYYRISHIDLDGSISVYKTIKVENHFNGIVVSCNSLGVFLDIKVINPTASNGFVELFTINGDIVSKTPIQLNENNNQYLIKKPIQNGLYFLRIIADGESIYNGKILVD